MSLNNSQWDWILFLSVEAKMLNWFSWKCRWCFTLKIRQEANRSRRHLHPFCFQTFDDSFMLLAWWGRGRRVGQWGGASRSECFRHLNHFSVLIVFYVFIKNLFGEFLCDLGLKMSLCHIYVLACVWQYQYFQSEGGGVTPTAPIFKTPHEITDVTFV